MIFKIDSEVRAVSFVSSLCLFLKNVLISLSVKIVLDQNLCCSTEKGKLKMRHCLIFKLWLVICVGLTFQVHTMGGFYIFSFNIFLYTGILHLF